MDHTSPHYDDPLFAWAPQAPCMASAPAAQQACTDASAGGVDVPAEFAPIWAVLARHRGQAAAITAPAIAAAAGLWPDVATVNRGTRVRKVLELAQDVWPEPLCGDSDGYYLAATAEEIAHAYANLTSRGKCIFRRRRSLRRAARAAGWQDLGHGRWADREEVPIAPHVG
jgi:hypothetical protein